jgi:hypothetical protein
MTDKVHCEDVFHETASAIYLLLCILH